MQVLRDPLFLGVEFLNVKEKDKGAVGLSVRMNLTRDDLIYMKSVKNRAEVCGYVHPDTGLFVAETEDMEPGSVYHRFRLEAVRFAREGLKKFLGELEGLDGETYKARGYKPYPVLANALKNCLVDRQALYADLQKQVNLIASRKFPKVNEFLAFADTVDITHPVTARLPYRNPENVVLEKGEKEVLDKFLDVFFDGYNKFAFAWYMGAALSNIPVYDDRVSKLAILSSAFGGSGKSTLANSMINALFTQHYRDIKDDFDSFFTIQNRFGTNALSTKRMCVYSESSWTSDPLSDTHDFSGINVSAIKSLVTEGYVSSEAKFGDRNMERLSGFHLVLTNHPPMVSPDDRAMNRRILPIMLRPTSMGEKARALGLWGRQRMDAFIQKHAEGFAAYFTEVFHADEYAFVERDYDCRDYVKDIQESQDDLDDAQREGRRKLDVLKSDGLFEFLDGLAKQEGINVEVLKNDIRDCLGGATGRPISPFIRMDGGKLYIDSSKSFLLRYGIAGTKIREALKEFYGEPVKKFHKRMFQIEMAEKP